MSSADLRRNAAREVDEAGVAPRELLDELALLDAEQRRELGRRAHRVLDQVGRRRDVVGRLGRGERDAAAIDDRAAPRRNGLHRLLLRGRGGREAAAVDQPGVRRLEGGGGEAEHEEREQDADAPLDERHAGQPPGRPGRRSAPGRPASERGAAAPLRAPAGGVICAGVPVLGGVACGAVPLRRRRRRRRLAPASPAVSCVAGVVAAGAAPAVAPGCAGAIAPAAGRRRDRERASVGDRIDAATGLGRVAARAAARAARRRGSRSRPAAGITMPSWPAASSTRRPASRREMLARACALSRSSFAGALDVDADRGVELQQRDLQEDEAEQRHAEATISAAAAQQPARG